MTESRRPLTFLKELVGFIGVVGGLVFVGLQVRQNTMAARASAYQQMGALLSDIWLQTASQPESAALTMKFFEDESAEFTPAEQAILINQTIGALRQFEATWRQVELGLLRLEVLDAFGWNSAGDPAFGINLKKLWPRIAPHMSPDFKAYLERKFGWVS
jgi:hypothetical protein